MKEIADTATGRTVLFTFTLSMAIKEGQLLVLTKNRFAVE